MLKIGLTKPKRKILNENSVDREVLIKVVPFRIRVIKQEVKFSSSERNLMIMNRINLNKNQVAITSNVAKKIK